MSWKRALEADARLAAKNSVLFRAALRQSVNFEAAFYGYLATTPNTDIPLPQQRARARAWAIINIRVNLESFKEVLLKTWAQAWVLGDLAAQEQVDLAREAKKADVATTVDWSKWKPGDEAAALLLKPPKAFQRLIEQQGIAFKGFTETTLKDLGNAIGEAIELGLPAKTAAKRIANHVASPARALTIAITEQNRAISEATKQRYLQNGVQRMEWLVFDPCPDCAKNEGVIVPINQPFPSGDTQPPAHPNCRCALAAVIPGVDDVDNAPGATIITPPTPTPAPVIAQIAEEVIETATTTAPALAAAYDTFVSGKWTELSDKLQKEEFLLAKLKENYPEHSKERLMGFLGKPEQSLIKKGHLYKNGNIQVRFYLEGADVPPKQREAIVAMVDELQVKNPKGEVVVIVGPKKKRAYGWAYLGGNRIWLHPKTAMTLEPNLIEGGKFKMPVLRDNPQWKYTLTHEWGHHIDDGNPWQGQTNTRKVLIKELKKQFPDAFRSEYAMEKPSEFVAEMFTEWYLTEGKTDNPLVQAVAKEFGWKI